MILIMNNDAGAGAGASTDAISTTGAATTSVEQPSTSTELYDLFGTAIAGFYSIIVENRRHFRKKWQPTDGETLSYLRELRTFIKRPTLPIVSPE